MPQISSAIGGAWLKSKRQILGSSSLVIDTKPLDGFTSLDYVITAKKADKTEMRSMYYRVVQENGSLKSSVHGKLGSLKMQVNEAIAGSNLELTIVNQETYDIEVTFARLILG
jgi:hypothetical protein